MLLSKGNKESLSGLNKQIPYLKNPVIDMITHSWQNIICERCGHF